MTKTKTRTKIELDDNELVYMLYLLGDDIDRLEDLHEDDSRREDAELVVKLYDKIEADLDARGVER